MNTPVAELRLTFPADPGAQQTLERWMGEQRGRRVERLAHDRWAAFADAPVEKASTPDDDDDPLWAVVAHKLDVVGEQIDRTQDEARQTLKQLAADEADRWVARAVAARRAGHAPPPAPVGMTPVQQELACAIETRFQRRAERGEAPPRDRDEALERDWQLFDDAINEVLADDPEARW